MDDEAFYDFIEAHGFRRPGVRMEELLPSEFHRLAVLGGGLGEQRGIEVCFERGEVALWMRNGPDSAGSIVTPSTALSPEWNTFVGAPEVEWLRPLIAMLGEADDAVEERIAELRQRAKTAALAAYAERHEGAQPKIVIWRRPPEGL